jgi:hypothetical protein
MASIDLKSEFSYVEEDEYAKLRGVEIQALRNERAKGKGPPYTKIGRKVVYPREALRKYLAASTVTPKRPPTLIDGPSKRSKARA